MRGRARSRIWPGPGTTAEDRDRFFGQTAAGRIHVLESAWLERMQACRLYAYRLPAESFTRDEVGGYWVSRESVRALDRRTCDDLVARPS
jgi:hypothetical protein